MKLKITNKETGKIWIAEDTAHVWSELALEMFREDSKCGIVYCDIEGIVSLGDDWYILDECGKWAYLPEKYNVERVKEKGK